MNTAADVRRGLKVAGDGAEVKSEIAAGEAGHAGGVTVCATAEALSTRFSLARFARSVRPRVYVTVPVLTLLGRSDELETFDEGTQNLRLPRPAAHGSPR